MEQTRGQPGPKIRACRKYKGFIFKGMGDSFFPDDILNLTDSLKCESIDSGGDLYAFVRVEDNPGMGYYVTLSIFLSRAS